MGAGQIGGVATLLDMDFKNAAGFVGDIAEASEGHHIVHYLSHAMMFCIGAIIEAHVVLTPASCVIGEKYKFDVFAGTHKFTEFAGIARTVEHICIHKGYNHTRRWLDCTSDNLALLVLNRQFLFHKREHGADFPVNRVRYGPGALKDDHRIGDRSCRYYGWGSRRNGYLIPLLINLRRVNVLIQPKEKCLAMWNYQDNYLCITQELCKMILASWVCWVFTVFIYQCHASQHDSGSDKNSIIVDNATEVLEAINGTPNFRLIKPNRATPWFPEREIKLDSCVRRARCELLDKSICLGTKLPYDKTSIHLTFYENQNQIQTQLELYKELVNVPKCWAVVQPLLCATFMPKCEQILGQDMVYLPSFEMCKITMEPCAILYNTSYFPSFLKCNATLFPPKCETPAREMKFNTTGKCLPPLIHTDKALHFYEGISGCGLPCRDPLYTEDEHQQIHRLVGWGAGTCLALNLLTVATFLIDWRSANKYPALVIFYINVCFAVASMGWLVQFGVGSRDDIVCSKDGTRRQGEPSAEENLSCVVVFVLVYYFMMAACVWFVIFTYAWHMSFRALGKIQDRIDKKAAYFHLVAWSLPLVLTIATMAFGEVDGSSVTGVCFVGYVNHPMRAALLLAPLSVVLVLGGYFLLRGVFSLIAVRVSSKDVISPRASNKIRQTITRCSLTAALVAVFICVTFACHIYEFRNADVWKDSFKKNIICRLEALKESGRECGGGARPSVSVLQLRLLSCFAAGALMASWTWTPAAAAAWRRYLARKCGCSVETEVTRRARKHELIARAYRRRGEFAARGRLSISLGGSRQDPVGLCLDHTSPIDCPDDGKHESAELSSSWAANLPRFVRRRDALVLPTHTHHSLSSTPDRRNSQDSQISISLRHVSVESRRNSLDSQLSVKIAEMKTKVGRRRTKHSKAKRKARAANVRKESTPSIESQISRYWLQAVAANNDPSREEVKFSFD